MYWFIIIIAAVVAISIGIMYRLSIREVDKKTVWREFVLVVTHMGLGISVSIVYYVIFLLSPDPLIDTVVHYMKVLISAAFLVSVICGIWYLKQGGAVLLDLGKSLQQKISVVAGCMFLLNGIIATIGLYVEYKGTIDLRCVFDLPLWIVIWYLYGLLFVFLGLTHNKIKESGIFFSDRFIGWERITSYEWEGDTGLTLTLKIKHPISLFRTLSKPVPAQHKDAVENFLKQHVTDDQE
ncbi:DUF5673 domain-containing protein [Candidatus Latescibacterota bacterium]